MENRCALVPALPVGSRHVNEQDRPAFPEHFRKSRQIQFAGSPNRLTSITKLDEGRDAVYANVRGSEAGCWIEPTRWEAVHGPVRLAQILGDGGPVHLPRCDDAPLKHQRSPGRPSRFAGLVQVGLEAP